MGINIYLDEQLLTAVDRAAQALGESRSAIIRQALEAWLQKRRSHAWPPILKEWRGEPEFPRFESTRPSTKQAPRDPFGSEA